MRTALLLIVAAMALLTLGLGTAFAEGEEEGPTTVDPVVVPETEAPPTSNPATAPVEPSASPAPSTSAPVSKPSESGSSSGGSTKHTSSPTTSGGSGGGSNSAPTHTNNNVSDGGGSSPSSSGGGQGGGSTHSASPTESSFAAPTSSVEHSTDSVERATSALAQATGQGAGKGKKSQQEAVGHLGEAVGKALLGNGVSVVKAKPQHDVVPDFVPLPAKSKTLYFLLILIVLTIASFVVWIQFRGPRASRRRKAHIDHRTAGAVRLTPAERLRARQWNTEHARARKARPTRRKAA